MCQRIQLKWKIKSEALYWYKLLWNVTEFRDRFKDINKEYDTFNTKIPLSEEETRGAFYNAVRDSSPELRVIFLVKSQTISEVTEEDMIVFITGGSTEAIEKFRDQSQSSAVTRVIRANRTTQK